jgi:NitT/TauT family transport system permease protein
MNVTTLERERGSTTSSLLRFRIDGRKVAHAVLPAATLALLMGAWQLYVRWRHTSKLVLPAPSDVWNAISAQPHLLLDSTYYTTTETLIGFALAIAVAVPLAVGISFSPVLQRTIYPLLLASQSVPKVALAPVVLVWFGYGANSRIFIVIIVAFFPIIVDTALGLRMTPPELLELSRSLRSSRWQTFSKVQFRGALPHFFSGLRIAITLAVVGAVIGEFVGSDRGLGNLILTATSQADTPLAFAALALLSVLGIVLFILVVLAEHLVTPWARTESPSDRHGAS